MSRWGVSIRTAKIHKMVIYDGFKKAKQVALDTKKKYADRPEITVELISRTKAFAPPSDLKLTHGDWWCPYCCKPRHFYWDDVFDLHRCPVCGMTDHNYYVKNYNHLWKHDLAKRKKTHAPR